jgi:hypothetical protein
MRALLAAAALLALALAGCSGGGGDPSPSGPSGGTTTSSTATATAAPVPTSDTLHFLAAPMMAPLLPPGSPEAATPVTVSDFGRGGNGPEGAEWRYTVTAPTNVTAGEVRVWVQVKETLYENPGTPLQPQCTWRLTAEVGADVEPVRSCINEPLGPIGPGTKELTYTLLFESPIGLEAGETITVRLERSAFSLSTNNAVDALSGSAEHDSRIVLRGLREPAVA